MASDAVPMGARRDQREFQQLYNLDVSLGSGEKEGSWLLQRDHDVMSLPYGLERLLAPAHNSVAEPAGGTERAMLGHIQAQLWQDDTVVSRLLPWTHSSSPTVQYNVLTLDAPTIPTQRVPHGGVSRLISSRKSPATASMERRGLALTLERDVLASNEGPEAVRRALDSLAACVNTTVAYDALSALVDHRRSSHAAAKMEGGGGGLQGAGVLEAMREAVQDHACLQRDSCALYSLASRGKETVLRGGHRADVLVLPPGASSYVALQRPEMYGGFSAQASEAARTNLADAGLPRVKQPRANLAKCDVYEPPYLGVSAQARSSPLVRESQLGEFHVFPVTAELRFYDEEQDAMVGLNGPKVEEEEEKNNVARRDVAEWAKKSWDKLCDKKPPADPPSQLSWPDPLVYAYYTRSSKSGGIRRAFGVATLTRTSREPEQFVCAEIIHLAPTPAANEPLLEYPCLFHLDEKSLQWNGEELDANLRSAAPQLSAGDWEGGKLVFVEKETDKVDFLPGRWVWRPKKNAETGQVQSVGPRKSWENLWRRFQNALKAAAQLLSAPQKRTVNDAETMVQRLFRPGGLLAFTDEQLQKQRLCSLDMISVVWAMQYVMGFEDSAQFSEDATKETTWERKVRIPRISDGLLVTARNMVAGAADRDRTWISSAAQGEDGGVDSSKDVYLPFLHNIGIALSADIAAMHVYGDEKDTAAKDQATAAVDLGGAAAAPLPNNAPAVLAPLALETHAALSRVCARLAKHRDDVALLERASSASASALAAAEQAAEGLARRVQRSEHVLARATEVCRAADAASRVASELSVHGHVIAALRVDQARGESPQLAAAIEREQRSAELLQRRASTGRDELAAARAAWAALAAGGDVSSDDAALCAGSTRATLVDQRGRRLQAVDERSLAASAHEIAQTTLLVASEQTGRHERSVRQHLREFFVEATGRVPAEEDFARALAVGAAPGESGGGLPWGDWAAAAAGPAGGAAQPAAKALPAAALVGAPELALKESSRGEGWSLMRPEFRAVPASMLSRVHPEPDRDWVRLKSRQLHLVFMRPRITHKMGTVVVAAGGGAVGATLHGVEADMKLQTDDRHMYGNFTFYSKAYVRDDTAYALHRDVFIAGYAHGGASESLDMRAKPSMPAQLHGDYMCTVVGTSSQQRGQSADGFVDITGLHGPEVHAGLHAARDRSRVGVHLACGPLVYARLRGWETLAPRPEYLGMSDSHQAGDKHVGKNRESQTFERAALSAWRHPGADLQRYAANTLLYRGSDILVQESSSGATGRVAQARRGLGHWGSFAFPGAAAVRRGGIGRMDTKRAAPHGASPMEYSQQFEYGVEHWLAAEVDAGRFDL